MDNWNLGGIADSKRQGVENSSFTLKNCDIHNDLGILKCHGGLEDDGSGTKPDENLVAIINASNNKSYHFGTDGTVWVRTSAGVYSQLGEITVGAAYGLIYDAVEFNGDIYYTMQQRVGKYTPGDAWGSRDDDFKTIAFDAFHPMKVIQNDLYVGNTNLVGKIVPGEAATGTITNALTLDSNYTVESFGEFGRYLTVGTRRQGASAGTFAGFSKLFKWDLISNTYSTEIEVKEFGISAFIEHEGVLIFNAGANGMLYSFDGNFVQEYKRIPNSLDNDTYVYKNAWSSLNGITLIGVSQLAGTGGVYSLGGYDAKYANVFNLPFSIATPTVNVIEWIGDDLVFSYLIATTKKLQKLSTTLATAETESLVQSLLDKKGNRVSVSPVVRYSSYPASTTIALSAKVDSGSYVALTLEKTANNELKSTTVKSGREVQYKLVLTPSGTNTPEVEFYG